MFFIFRLIGGVIRFFVIRGLYFIAFMYCVVMAVYFTRHPACHWCKTTVELCRPSMWYDTAELQERQIRCK
jgi:hypothetical protein